jgi:hypothetical protein
LKKKPRRFISMTSLTVPEFDALVPTFIAELTKSHSLASVFVSATSGFGAQPADLV